MSTMSPELALVDPAAARARGRGLAADPALRVSRAAALPARRRPAAAPSVPRVGRARVPAVAIVRTFAFDAFVFLSVAVCVLLANLFA